jgi:ABC-type bacteriocin/lantibiotic exporter with double-glycine peptidase domain
MLTAWLALIIVTQNPEARDIVYVDRNTCGLNSLSLVLAFLSSNPDQSELSDLLPIDKAPFSFEELDSAACRLGYKTSLVHWRSVHGASFDCPTILHIRSKRSSGVPDHFLACFGETSDGLFVAEFPYPPFILPRHRLEQIWSGDALYIEKPTGTVTDDLRRESHWGRVSIVLNTALILGLFLIIGIEVRRVRREAPTAADAQ